MQTGTSFQHLVLFDKGQPTSDLTYALYDQDNNLHTTDTVEVDEGQVSYLIEIDGAENTLGKPLFEQMKLQWSYTTATESVSDEFLYRLHIDTGFDVSEDNVRNMLGVDEEEIPNQDIDLFAGYLA